MDFIISHHSKIEMERRQIKYEYIESILQNPDQIVSEYDNLKAYQSRIVMENGKEYLI